MIKALSEPVEENHSFILRGNQKVRSVSELADVLSELTDEEYDIHVSDSKNDFASWIDHVYHNKELAEKLKQARNRDEALLCLIGALVGDRGFSLAPKRSGFSDQSSTSDSSDTPSSHSFSHAHHNHLSHHAPKHQKGEAVHGEKTISVKSSAALKLETVPESMPLPPAYHKEHKETHKEAHKENHNEVRAVDKEQPREMAKERVRENPSFFARFFSKFKKEKSAPNAPAVQEQIAKDIVKVKTIFANSSSAEEKLLTLYEVQEATNERFLKLLEENEEREQKARLMEGRFAAFETQLRVFTEQQGSDTNEQRMKMGAVLKQYDTLQEAHSLLEKNVASNFTAVEEKQKEMMLALAEWGEKTERLKTASAEVAKLVASVKNDSVLAEKREQERSEQALKRAVQILKEEQEKNNEKQEKKTHEIVRVVHNLVKELDAQKNVVERTKSSITNQEAEIAKFRGVQKALEAEFERVGALAEPGRKAHEELQKVKVHLEQELGEIKQESAHQMQFILEQLKSLQKQMLVERKSAENEFMKGVVKAIQERRSPPSLDTIKYHEIHDIKKAVEGLKDEISRMEKKSKKTKKNSSANSSSKIVNKTLTKSD